MSRVFEKLPSALDFAIFFLLFKKSVGGFQLPLTAYMSTKGAYNLQNKEIMKREQIINKIYDKIRDDLLHAKLLYWEEDDANKYPLVDHLSSGNDISTGRDEIDNLIEQIEIEPLIDAILALPLEVPRDEEIIYGVQYNPMIHESVFGCLSLHRSRKEAEIEMEFHKHQRMKEDDYSDVERWTIYEYKLK